MAVGEVLEQALEVGASAGRKVRQRDANHRTKTGDGGLVEVKGAVGGTNEEEGAVSGGKPVQAIGQIPSHLERRNSFQVVFF